MAASRVWTTDPSVVLPIDVKEEGSASLEPMTVVKMFRDRAALHPNNVALAVERPVNNWVEWTWEDYHKDVCSVAKAMLSIGLTPKAGVCIIGFNSPEWLIANCAAIFAGGISAGIYTTNSEEATAYVVEQCKAEFVFVEDRSQLSKVLARRSSLPLVRRIVMWREKATDEEKAAGVVDWKDFVESGKDVDGDQLEERIAAQVPGQCCTLIYTSGTTGPPKGAMLSHDNLTWTASQSALILPPKLSREPGRSISYLPLSHIAAQMLDIYLPLAPGDTIAGGASVFFARPDALKGSLPITMKQVRPTSFLGVPRVWEKIQAKIRAVGESNGAVAQWIAGWAKEIGLQRSVERQHNGDDPWGYWLASTLVFENVKSALGLENCSLCVTGAAPVSPETSEYFMSLDLPLMEAYGMSESSGIITFSMPDGNFRLGSCGKAVPGIECILRNKDEAGCGEVAYRGRNRFMGYYANDKATEEAIDDDGFMRTGDLARMDEEGYLYITGRIKELIITAGGENVAPVPIEDAIKAALPFCNNAMVVGDRRRFLSAVLTLQVDVDDDGVPSKSITKDAQKLLQARGCTVTTVQEAVESDTFSKLVTAGIKEANKKAVSNAQKVQKWVLAPDDFSIPGGEMTGTMKLKRKVIGEKYEKEVEALYAEAKK